MEVKLVKQNGALKININNEMIEPLSFKSFRPTDKNISDFYKAGVKLFSILTSGLNSILGVQYSLFGESWIGENEYDVSVVDEQIDLFRKNAPDAYFALMFQMDTREWYLEQNEGCPDSFRCLSQIAGNKQWRESAAAYLKAIINHVEEKYGDCFYGYFLLGGKTTEWFSAYDYAESHPYKEEAYKEYRKDQSVTIPDKELRERCSAGTFYDPAQDKEAIEYWRFHHELIADTILYFAKEAQSIIKHKKLLGVYFGYLFELDGERLWNDAHLAYEKVFLSDDIDMISSPSSYAHRKHSDTSAFMVTYDTLALHDKLYYLEFDHITHLAPQYIDGFAIPGFDSQFANEQETIDVMRRDFMLCVTKGAGLWWFDMFEGWFYSETMMNEVKAMIEISKKLAQIPNKSVSEIAVFAEGESLLYTDKNADINTDCLGLQREGLARMGAPYDLYSIADIDNIEHDNYKLYIFLNAFKMSEKTREVLKKKIKVQNKTVLWIYAPDYIHNEAVSTKYISEMTGMDICLLSQEEVTVDVDFGDRGEVSNSYGCSKPQKTMFYAENADEVWGRYRNSKKAALACKKLGDFNSIYSGAGNIPGNVLKNIARFAGVHIYGTGNDAIFVSEKLIGVYPEKEGEIEIVLDDTTVLEELFSKEQFNVMENVLKFKARKGEARLFLKR